MALLVDFAEQEDARPLMAGDGHKALWIQGREVAA